MAEVVDLSAFQSPSVINYSELATAVQAAIVKATDGLGSPDPAFMAHVTSCQSVGIEAGAYHFLRVRKGRPQDATDQAKEFCDRYLAAACTLLPCLDIEDPPQTPESQWASPQEYAQAIHDFLAVLDTALPGKRAAYSYPYFFTKYLTSPMPDLATCVCWWADYSSANPIAPSPWNAAPLLHQYTEGGTVPGYIGKIDRSRSAGSLYDLKRIAIAPTPTAA